MATGTTTRIEIRCEADDDGVTRLRTLDASGLLRARALPPIKGSDPLSRGDSRGLTPSGPGAGGVARVALVQTAASLLAGDRVEIAVWCGPGCRLELIEVAGMVAHDVRGGEAAELDVLVALGSGARMAWAAQPLTLAEGCDLRRGTRVRLEEGAALLWRDTVVLGRVGEEPGRMVADVDVRHMGLDLHAEQLDTGDRALLTSPVVLGAGARVLDTLALYGARAEQGTAGAGIGGGADNPTEADGGASEVDADRGGVLQLAGSGSISPLPARSVATAAAVLDPMQVRWRAELFSSDLDLQEDPHHDVRLALSPGRGD